MYNGAFSNNEYGDSSLEGQTKDSTYISKHDFTHMPHDTQQPPPEKNRRSSIKRNQGFSSPITDTELCKYLMTSCNIDELKHRIALLVKKLGFSNFLFIAMNTILENSVNIHSLPSELIEIYRQNNYYKHDWLWNCLRTANKAILGSTLHDYIYAAPFATEEIIKNREIIKLIKSFNYDNFYAIPANSENNRKCALIIWGVNMPKPEFQSQIKLCEGRLELLCNAINHVHSARFEKASAGNKTVNLTLTARPKELLVYMAFHDCTLYQAAERMNISVKTANVHIASAKKALGVKTTSNAISRAIEYGLIKPD